MFFSLSSVYDESFSLSLSLARSFSLDKLLLGWHIFYTVCILSCHWIRAMRRSPFHHKHYLFASGIIYLLSKIRFLNASVVNLHPQSGVPWQVLVNAHDFHTLWFLFFMLNCDVVVIAGVVVVITKYFEINRTMYTKTHTHIYIRRLVAEAHAMLITYIDQKYVWHLIFALDTHTLTYTLWLKCGKCIVFEMNSWRTFTRNWFSWMLRCKSTERRQ